MPFETTIAAFPLSRRGIPNTDMVALDPDAELLARIAAGETRALGRPGTTSEAIDAEHPRIFVYDNYPGGIGFSEPLFRMTQDLLDKTRELVLGCPCESGCPSCVGPLGETGPQAKTVALDILSRLPSVALAQAAGDEFPADWS